MQKNLIQKIFQTAKKISSPPLFAMKIWVNPMEKHVNSIFFGKIVVIVFRAPLQGSKILRAPFLHQEVLPWFADDKFVHLL